MATAFLSFKEALRPVVEKELKRCLIRVTRATRVTRITRVTHPPPPLAIALPCQCSLSYRTPQCCLLK